MKNDFNDDASIDNNDDDDEDNYDDDLADNAAKQNLTISSEINHTLFAQRAFGHGLGTVTADSLVTARQQSDIGQFVLASSARHGLTS
jgi:hypothetical protein